MKNSGQKGFILMAVLAVCAVIITYLNHFNNDFHFDDTHTITNNAYIRNISNLPLFFTDMKTFGSMPDNLGYRPVVTASTAIDYWVAGGYKPLFFHLSVFIMFILQGFLMFFLLLKIAETAAKGLWNKIFALTATLIYMLHPGNAETINYIIARSDSFSTLFVIAGLLCYARSGLCRRYYLYLLPVAAGILSKETAVMFPLLLFVYIYLIQEKGSLNKILGSHRRHFFRSLRQSLPALLFTLALAILVQVISYRQTSNSGILHSPANGLANHFWYVMSQPYVLFTYFLNFFAPVSLSSDPGIMPFAGFSDPRMYLGFGFVILMLWIAFKTSAKPETAPIAFGILWFFIAAIPTSLLATLTQVSNSHRLFFLYVGLVVAMGWAISLFIIKISPVFSPKTLRKWVAAIVVLICFAFAAGTYQRNEVWETEASLWYDIIQKNPDNPRGLMNYGLTRMAVADYAEAEYYFRRALKLWPGWPYLHINMGILTEVQGRLQESEQYYLNAIAYSNNNPDGYYYYAKFLYGQKRHRQAIANLLTAIEMSPGYAGPRYLLMTIYAEQGDFDLLKPLAEETLALIPGDKATINYLQMCNGRQSLLDLALDDVKRNPTPESFLNLSLQWYNRGEYQKCIDACNEALRLRPGYAEAYNNICSAYNAMQMWEEGEKACRKALELKPDYELARNNLQWAASNRK